MNYKKTKMEKQTAIESLIEKLKEHIRQSAHNELGTNRTGDYRIGLTKAIEFCEEHLEMEKQQIIDSFEIGYDNGACVQEGSSIYHGGNYYNENFNQPLNKNYEPSKHK
jgi:hypothetical protein